MEKHEYPATVALEIKMQEQGGYELLDVDVWDFPLTDEYVLTFRQKDDPCKTVRVVFMEIDTFEDKVKASGTLQMYGDQFRHVAQVLDEKEAQEHAAV